MVPHLTLWDAANQHVSREGYVEAGRRLVLETSSFMSTYWCYQHSVLFGAVNI